MEALMGLLIIVGGFFLICFGLLGVVALWGFISNKSKKPTFEDKYNEWYKREFQEFYNHRDYLIEKRSKESKSKK